MDAPMSGVPGRGIGGCMPQISDMFTTLCAVMEHEAYQVQSNACIEEIYWKIDDMLFTIDFAINGFTILTLDDPIICQTYLNEVKYV